MGWRTWSQPPHMTFQEENQSSLNYTKDLPNNFRRNLMNSGRTFFGHMKLDKLVWFWRSSAFLALTWPRLPQLCIATTMKHEGGNVQIWGFESRMCRRDDIYRWYYECYVVYPCTDWKEMINLTLKKPVRRVIFKRDSHPKHTRVFTNEKTMTRSGTWPDLNSIQHLCNI